MPPYTPKQGQYLAFIYHYTKLNRRPPAEADIQRFFRVTPPTVHQMILTLEAKGLISREPWQARSVKVLMPVEERKLSLHKLREACSYCCQNVRCNIANFTDASPYDL